MDIIQSPVFYKAFKKLHKNEQLLMYVAIREVVANPELGDIKTANLSGLRVYKFKINHQLILMAYEYLPQINTLNLLAFGSHENFYRDLSRSIH